MDSSEHMTAASAEEKSDEVFNLRGRRVLVVEDETLLAMCLQDSLEAHGATVIGPIDSIEAALEAVSSSAIDIAVLDVNLHGGKVYPVADALREHGVPFLLTTSDARGLLPERFGSTPYVQKPCDTDDVCETLRVLGSP
jgi:DNA-binding response OmpR family regulator